ncbi:MAG TPA: hypothetical protein VLL69_08905 [Streptosporangiaceae bacterium]|nr:hypothetical protein [Streptosporangiaceae bacterium]
MKRAALICTVLSVLLLGCGIWMQAVGFHPGDQNTFFGNPQLILSDGQVTLILSGLLIAATAAMWLAVARRSQQPARPQPDSGGQLEPKSKV